MTLSPVNSKLGGRMLQRNTTRSGWMGGLFKLLHCPLHWASYHCLLCHRSGRGPVCVLLGLTPIRNCENGETCASLNNLPPKMHWIIVKFSHGTSVIGCQPRAHFPQTVCVICKICSFHEHLAKMICVILMSWGYCRVYLFHWQFASWYTKGISWELALK